MAAPTKDYLYQVEFNVHAVDAPGARLIRKGDIYLNICLLGKHKRTRLMPAYLPMHIDQKLFFDKVFKFCYDPDDIVQRLEREHVLIELIQNDIPSPVLLASYEIPAKSFLYPYSSDRIEYTGLRRYVLLNRTIDFPGISPSFEFSTSPSVDDVTGFTVPTSKTRRLLKPVKRSASPTWRLSSSFPIRPVLNGSAPTSRSITSHTISSAIRHDHGQIDTQEKLRELAVDRDVNYVIPVDKTRGRPPFVVRHVTNDLIGRRPEAHNTFKDPLVINDYTLSRLDNSTSSYSVEHKLNRSRSLSPVLGRSVTSIGARERSPSPSRFSPTISQSIDLENRGRSSSRYLYEDYGNYRNSDIYYSSPSRYSMSPTLHRPSFRVRYGLSPAADLSDKIIYTLQRNLSSYSARPLRHSYSFYGYTDAHTVDDDIVERSRRIMQE